MARIPFNPREIAITVRGEIGKEQLAVYAKLIPLLVRGTPRKTGLAQGNWRTRLNRPATSVIARKSGGGAIASGLRTVRAAKARIQRGRPTKIFITNNVPYIGLLNAGSSVQAPAFFIEVAFRAASSPGTPQRKNI